MPGPYVISDITLLTTLVGQDAVIPPSDAAYGVQCVGLVKVYGGCPRTADWRQGSLVTDTPTLRRGMAIATFVKGIYPNHASGNHACFFVDFLPDDTGFTVLEQHVLPNPNRIQTRIIYYDDSKLDPPSNGNKYSVIL